MSFALFTFLSTDLLLVDVFLSTIADQWQPSLTALVETVLANNRGRKKRGVARFLFLFFI